MHENWSRFGVITFRVKLSKTVACIDGWAWILLSRAENTDTTILVSDSRRVDRGEPGGHSFTPYRTMVKLLLETDLDWGCVPGVVGYPNICSNP